jgi:hypothetical protein
MVRIDSEYFDIICYEYDDGFPKTFECDDYIAPVISLLNKRGYYTKNCCEGHVSPSYYNTERSEYLRIDKVYITYGIYYSGAYIMMDDKVTNIPVEDFPFNEWRIEINDIYQNPNSGDILLGRDKIDITSKEEYRKIYKKLNKKGMKHIIIIRQKGGKINEYIKSISDRDANYEDMYRIIHMRNKDIEKLYKWAKELKENLLFKRMKEFT